MSARYGRRDFLRLGAAGIGGVALIGGAGTDAGAATRQPAKGHHGGGKAGKARRGGHLQMGITAETDGVDPTISNLASPGMYYAHAVFDPLTIVASDGTVKPYLAQAVTPNATYDQWTIKLRPGVLFHDGTALDAAALAHYFNYVMQSPTFAFGLKGLISGVSVADPLTMVMKLNVPWVAFPAYLTGGVGSSQLGLVAAPSMLGNPNGASNPVGTGPFVFKSWDPGNHFTVVRNPHYWRKGLPYLDQIDFHPIEDDTARLQSLQSGTVDLIQTAAARDIATLRANRSFNTVDNLSELSVEPLQNFIMLNTQMAPLDDVRIRQAIAYATDQQKVIEVTVAGLTSPSRGPFSAGNHARKSPYDAKTGYPSFDLAKARRLVAQYRHDKGHPKPFPLQLSGTTALDQLQLLQQMWKKAGIEVSGIDSVDDNTNISRVLVGNYHATPWQQFGAPDPDLNYAFWTSGTVAAPGKLAINFARNSDPQIDKAMDEGRANPNRAARVKAYRKVAQRLGADVPYIWISTFPWIVAGSSNVHGFGSMSLPGGGRAQAMSYGDVWLTEAWVG